MPCQFFNQGTCTHNSTHETRGVLYRYVCSSCFTRNGKAFSHSEVDCKNKHKVTKKSWTLVKTLGISQNIGTYFGQRIVLNGTKKFRKNYDQEFRVPKSRYTSCFHTSKAFANVHNGRTYAQVVSQISNQSRGSFVNRDNVKGTRIVTVPQGNTNASLVTSSKVSIKPKPSRASSTGLKHKFCSQYPGKPAAGFAYLPVKNSFQVLQNLDENICEIQGNVPSALDDIVTASAVPTVQKPRGNKPYKASNIKNACSVDEKTNTSFQTYE